MPDNPKSTAVRAVTMLKTLAEGLWFPALFFIGFMLCYLLPFHDPTPHHVKVAVSDQVAAARISAALGQKAPGSFDIIPAQTGEQARQTVLDRDAVAAFAIDGRQAVLYTAGSDGAYLTQAVTQTFTPIAGAQHATLKTVDLAPSAHGDKTGTGLFYLAMAWNIVPYICVMMLARLLTLTRRAKLATLVGVGAVISVAGYYFGYAIGVVPDQPLAILYAFLVTQAVGWTVYGLVPFVRQFIPGVSVLLFVLLSIPSSGGAIPRQMVPGFFRWLHPIMPLGNLVDALRGIFYFDGKGLLRPTLVISAWIVFGVLLVALGAFLQHRNAAMSDTDDQAEADAESDLEAEYVIEDPVLQAPAAHAVRPGGGPGVFGDNTPILQGTVTNLDRVPIHGAIVTVTDSGGRQLLRVRTDELGRYAVTGLPERFITIVVSAPGWLPAAVRALPTSGHPLTRNFALRDRHMAVSS